MRNAKIILDGETLTLKKLRQIALTNAKISLSPKARKKVLKSREFLEKKIREGASMYGITTGFGPFGNVRISQKDIVKLQENLVRSHAVGVGAPFSVPETRAIMAARVNTLAKGYSAVRIEALDLLLQYLNKGIIPLVPEKGSVGASGDLAPLAHIALALIGEGEVFYRGRQMPTAMALKKAKIAPMRLAPKDGLALINGTQAMTAVGALALERAWNTVLHAEVATAMTVDALLASKVPFDEKIHKLRPQRGQSETARNLRALLSGYDEIMRSHKNCGAVQDSYTLRCAPQVQGAVRDALRFAVSVVECELNSVSDNPMVFADKAEILSGGNFHGQPVSQALDFSAIAMATLANISERRTERLLNNAHSKLPAFLVKEGGLNSGFMMLQVLAAALASENKILAHPASVDTIPTSANQEDHVSMGLTAARKFRDVAENTRTIIAVELLVSAQALDFRAPMKPAPPLADAHKAIRKKIPHLRVDRNLKKDIQTMSELMDTNYILDFVNRRRILI